MTNTPQTTTNTGSCTLNIFEDFLYYNVIKGGIWNRGSETFVHLLIVVLGSFP